LRRPVTDFENQSRLFRFISFLASEYRCLYTCETSVLAGYQFSDYTLQDNFSTTLICTVDAILHLISLLYLLIPFGYSRSFDIYHGTEKAS
jgi:hypothetical protein